jgi:L-alanine-DL-glutamate epimerase-like enolase superfamily enzyme
MKITDIAIKRVGYTTEDFTYRTPIKFGGFVLDRVTLLNTEVEVETGQGKKAVGRASMPLGNIWAFPSRSLGYEQTLGAMKRVVERVAKIYGQAKLSGHPIDLTWQLESSFFAAADEESKQLALAEPIPRLATLVAASPFDAAIHDAFGKVHRVSSYHTYGPDFLDNDLGRFFGAEFRGVTIDQHVTREPVASLPLYHLVGALDPLSPQDVVKPIGDGLPETLGEWITFNGLTHLKIKLNGDDLNWDVQRVLAVEVAAAEAQSKRGVRLWHYSLDFNEKCQNVAYLLEFIARVRAGSEAAFRRIAYIEQPTARDLSANRQNVMHEASAIIPVVIDESLLDLESLLQAREMGYTGAALKACKGQTQSILLACAARHLNMFLCVQDLTCPGASLIHSAGLAAHVKGVTAIEANSRQYCPNANAAWAPQFPGIFDIKDGQMQTGSLTGPGLGAFS